jgi:NADPH-dependent F420 reductase
MASELLGFLGGTGPLGRGLGLRLAVAGYPVVLGSRDAARAQDQAAQLKAQAGGGDLRGAANEDVVRQADVVFVTMPYEGQRASLEGLAPHLDGKLVVNTVNALDFAGGPHAVPVAAGSAAEECRDLLPGARVTAAFHTISAPKLLDLDARLEGDVPVCGDDAADRERVVALAGAIDGLRGLHAGPLYHSGGLERLTAMIISMNKHYRTSAGIAFTNIRTAPAPTA